MMDLVCVDIGGTHARFALARVAGGRVIAMGEPVTLKTAAHASFRTAWEAFAAGVSGPLPPAAAIALAAPVGGETIRLTNNSWVIQPGRISAELGLAECLILNDFAAIAHAVAGMPDDGFEHVCGPERPLPRTGVVGVCGPGTGLGVAAIHHRDGGYHVLPSEGGHQDFAPVDAVDDALLARLRTAHLRVSVERVVSGPGIVAIHETLAALERREAAPATSDADLWRCALSGRDSLAAAALDRFCLALGSFAGDLALVQGAGGIAIAGGLGLRLRAHLPRSGFAARFTAKGRFAALLEQVPVKLVVHPQPGLFGAAAAFAQRCSSSSSGGGGGPAKLVEG